MKILTACVLLTGSSFLPGGALTTEYKTDRALRMEIESTLQMETARMEITRDGEPQQGRGGGASETRHKEVHVDRVLEVKEGKPTKVRRSFESLSGKTSMTMGDTSNESEVDCPLDGATLEIERDGDKVDVAAVEGKTPEGKALENHVPENFLDALLPEGDMKVDSTWELDSDAVKRALRLDVVEALYPRPERPEGGGEGEGRGRGRRGMRGNTNFLREAEWRGKAKLVAMDHDVNGKPCAVIELKVEASGDLPEPEFGGGRGGRMFEPALPGRAAAKSTYDVSLEGKLLFSIPSKHPVSLDLEGSAKTEVEREFTREESTTKMHVVMEGNISYRVTVAEESAKAEK